MAIRLITSRSAAPLTLLAALLAAAALLAMGEPTPGNDRLAVHTIPQPETRP